MDRSMFHKAWFRLDKVQEKKKKEKEENNHNFNVTIATRANLDRAWEITLASRGELARALAKMTLKFPLHAELELAKVWLIAL